MSETTRTSHLSDADLARLRRKLEDLRASIVGIERGSLHPQAPDASTGDSADLAEVTIEQDVTLRRATSETRLLLEVERALAKLDAGTYGISEDSGEPIELARLEAVPWARRTTAEEEQNERERAGVRHTTA